MKSWLLSAGLLAGLFALPGRTLATTEASASLRADHPGPVINKDIYGQFAEHLGHCIYEGVWVGPDSAIPNTRGLRNDVVGALREMGIPILRWPGGCFADEYHWRDGIGPREKRPSMINTHWGGVVESNAFGTHEFFDLCEQLGCEAYVNGNVGSGTVQEMMEWVEYMSSDANSPLANLRRQNGRDKPFKIKYFGVGNESWGCGGNMRPEYYADLYRRYNTFVKNYGDQKILRVACGANASDYQWTDKVMESAARHMHAISLHYYTLPSGSWRGPKGSATDFDEAMWFRTIKRTLFMEELITRHVALMDKHDPEKKVGLIVDEWGTWYDVEPGTNPGFLFQQNTLRDAMIAALNLNIFHRHADRVVMTNIAQMVNVLQSVILTDKEKMVLTPTYHVFRLYKVHQGATFLPVELSAPDYALGDERMSAVDATASRAADGKVHLTLVNVHPTEPCRVHLRLVGVKARQITGEVLTSATMQAHNSFATPELVKPSRFDAVTQQGDDVVVEMPSKAVVALELCP